MKLLISHDATGEDLFDRQVKTLTGSLQSLVNIWSGLGFGAFQPEDLFSLVQHSQGLYESYKSNYINQIHKQDEKKQGRKLSLDFTATSIVLPSPDLLYAEVDALGTNRRLFLSAPGLFAVVKGKVLLIPNVAAEYKEQTFKKYLTNPDVIKEYELLKKFAEVTTEFSRAFQKNNPRERSLVYVEGDILYDFNWRGFIKYDKVTGSVQPRIERFLNM